MKKLIFAILTLISMFSFFMLFNEAQINSANNIKNVEDTLKNTHNVIIPNAVTNKDQAKVYKVLKETLDKYKGNIYYSRIEEENKNGKNISKEIKYVYFNNLDYFKALKLSEGRSFSLSERESNLFLSTDKTGKSDQIGTIASINKDSTVEVHTLSKLIENGLLLDGYCYIQLPQDKSIKDFIKDLEKGLQVNDIKVMEKHDYEAYKISYKWMVILGLYFICMLLVIYDILRSYKKIAIKKMMGFTKADIYFSTLKGLVLIQVSVQVIVTAILSFVKFDNYNPYVYMFLKDLIVVYAIELAALIVAVTIPYIYTNKIRIADMLKNKQPTKEILAFNALVKVVVIIGFFIVTSFIMQDFDSFKNLYSKSFKNWESTEGYVVLPYFSSDVSNDYLASEKSSKEQRQIYNYFNRKGAILADFSEFIPIDRKTRLAETKYPYESDNVWVNPNYLKLNPIYDIDGNAVKVSEDVETEVILVPVKYKNYEKDIIAKHQFWNKGDKDAFVKNRKIKIIWIKNEQSIFSYNLDVNPESGNCVTDTFVNVRTESNGGGWDYNIVMAYSGNPFKIKLDPNLSIDENVRPELEKFGYSRYIPKISKVNAMVEAQGDQIKEKMYLYLGTASLMALALTIILIQNVYNFFNQYKQYLAIRYLQGYGLYEMYKEYFSLILSSWIIISVIVYLTGKVNLYFQIQLSLILILLEIALSLIVLKLRNKKNIANVIKGR